MTVVMLLLNVLHAGERAVGIRADQPTLSAEPGLFGAGA